MIVAHATARTARTRPARSRTHRRLEIRSQRPRPERSDNTTRRQSHKVRTTARTHATSRRLRPRTARARFERAPPIVTSLQQRHNGDAQRPCKVHATIMCIGRRAGVMLRGGIAARGGERWIWRRPQPLRWPARRKPGEGRAWGRSRRHRGRPCCWSPRRPDAPPESKNSEVSTGQYVVGRGAGRGEGVVRAHLYQGEVARALEVVAEVGIWGRESAPLPQSDRRRRTMTILSSVLAIRT